MKSMNHGRKLHHLISNLIYVNIDRQAARDHWVTMSEFVGSELGKGNHHLLVQQKTVAGILGHNQRRGFVIHRIKERSVLRRIGV